jgi:putative spermidine/putrescine transport system ATP-binding protein
MASEDVVVGGSGGPAVRLDGVAKHYGDVRAVDGVDLEIRQGEFFSMLGPSGSGKTTVLRIVAGFEKPDVGQVRLAGADVTRLAPFDRDVNTVFQDYALFPHLTVRENVEYGLRVRRVAKAERRERAEQALASVRLEGYGERRPTQLSGGQRQRVALARALVNRPKVLLLDEPLGALDLKLRLEMQLELKQIQRDAGITFVFVTHDQDEAMTLSDRIAVFNAGRVEQVGTPAEVYEQPSTPFVAGFVGTSNVFGPDAALELMALAGTYSVRPERMRVVTDADGANQGPDGECVARGTVAEVVYAGAQSRILVDLDAGLRVVVSEPNTESRATRSGHDRGARVAVAWRREHAVELSEI